MYQSPSCCTRPAVGVTLSPARRHRHLYGGGIRHLLGGLWNLAGNASGGWTGWTGWMARTMTYSLESGGVNLGAVCVEDV